MRKNQFRSRHRRNKNKIEKSQDSPPSTEADVVVGLGSHYYCSRLVCSIPPPLSIVTIFPRPRLESSSFRPKNYFRPHRSLFLYIFFPKNKWCKTHGHTVDRASKRILHEGHISQYVFVCPTRVARDSYKRNPRERWGTLYRCQCGRRDLVSLDYGVPELFTSGGCRCGDVSRSVRN